MTIVKCLFCGKEFNKKPSQILKRPHNFCSKECVKLYSFKENVIIKKKKYAELHIKDIIVLIDIEDIDKINKIKWSANYDKTINSYYIVGWERNNYKNRKRIKLHRYLMNCPDNMQVDHINRNTLDNRKKNLRIVTQQGNANNKGNYKSNTSGYKNISKQDKYGGYTLRIKRNKNIIIQKYSKDLQELIKIRDEFLINESEA